MSARPLGSLASPAHLGTVKLFFKFEQEKKQDGDPSSNDRYSFLSCVNDLTCEIKDKCSH